MSISHKSKSLKNKLYFGLILIMTIVLILSIKETVYSVNGDQAAADMERYYRTLENEYRQSVTALVEQMGYSNAGVMLTKMVDADGNREYEIRINHRRLKKGSEELIEAIELVELPIDNSSISIMTSY